MLSLGYPKTNFQVANNMARDQLLECVRERIHSAQNLEVVERPITPADNNQKQMAFKVWG